VAERQDEPLPEADETHSASARQRTHTPFEGSQRGLFASVHCASLVQRGTHRPESHARPAGQSA
jgi:hypothetical protein